MAGYNESLRKYLNAMSGGRPQDGVLNENNPDTINDVRNEISFEDNVQNTIDIGNNAIANANNAKQPDDASFLEKAYNTIEGTYESIQKGVLDWIDSIFDFGAGIVGAGASLFGNESLADDIADVIAYDWQSPVVQYAGGTGNWINFVSKIAHGDWNMSTDEYNQRMLNGGLFSPETQGTINNVASGVGSMLATMAVGDLVGGTVSDFARPLMGGTTTANQALEIGNKARSITVNALGFLRGAGSGYETVAKDGGDFVRGSGYAFLNGAMNAIENAVEDKIGGAIAGARGIQDSDKLLPMLGDMIAGRLPTSSSLGAKAVISTAIQILGSSAVEGIEEALETAIDPLMKTFYDDGKAFQEAYGDSESAMQTLGEIGMSFLVGSLTSSIVKSINIGETYSNTKHNLDYIDTQRMISDIQDDNVRVLVESQNAYKDMIQLLNGRKPESLNDEERAKHDVLQNKLSDANKQLVANLEKIAKLDNDYKERYQKEGKPVYNRNEDTRNERTERTSTDSDRLDGAEGQRTESSSERERIFESLSFEPGEAERSAEGRVFGETQEKVNIEEIFRLFDEAGESIVIDKYDKKTGESLFNQTFKCLNETDSKRLFPNSHKLASINNAELHIFTNIIEDQNGNFINGIYDPSTNRIFVSALCGDTEKVTKHEIYHKYATVKYSQIIVDRIRQLIGSEKLGKIFDAYNTNYSTPDQQEKRIHEEISADIVSGRIYDMFPEIFDSVDDIFKEKIEHFKLGIDTLFSKITAGVKEISDEKRRLFEKGNNIVTWNEDGTALRVWVTTSTSAGFNTFLNEDALTRNMHYLPGGAYVVFFSDGNLSASYAPKGGGLYAEPSDVERNVANSSEPQSYKCSVLAENTLVINCEGSLWYKIKFDEIAIRKDEIIDFIRDVESKFDDLDNAIDHLSDNPYSLYETLGLTERLSVDERMEALFDYIEKHSGVQMYINEYTNNHRQTLTVRNGDVEYELDDNYDLTEQRTNTTFISKIKNRLANITFTDIEADWDKIYNSLFELTNLYAVMSNASHNDNDWEGYSTDRIVGYAYMRGYDSVLFQNLDDYTAFEKGSIVGKPADVLALCTPNHPKVKFYDLDNPDMSRPEINFSKNVNGKKAGNQKQLKYGIDYGSQKIGRSSISINNGAKEYARAFVDFIGKNDVEITNVDGEDIEYYNPKVVEKFDKVATALDSWLNNSYSPGSITIENMELDELKKLRDNMLEVNEVVNYLWEIPFVDVRDTIVDFEYDVENEPTSDGIVSVDEYTEQFDKYYEADLKAVEDAIAKLEGKEDNTTDIATPQVFSPIDKQYESFVGVNATEDPNTPGFKKVVNVSDNHRYLVAREVGNIYVRAEGRNEFLNALVDLQEMMRTSPAKIDLKVSNETLGVYLPKKCAYAINYSGLTESALETLKKVVQIDNLTTEISSIGNGTMFGVADSQYLIEYKYEDGTTAFKLPVRRYSIEELDFDKIKVEGVGDYSSDGKKKRINFGNGANAQTEVVEQTPVEQPTAVETQTVEQGQTVQPQEVEQAQSVQQEAQAQQSTTEQIQAVQATEETNPELQQQALDNTPETSTPAVPELSETSTGARVDKRSRGIKFGQEGYDRRYLTDDEHGYQMAFQDGEYIVRANGNRELLSALWKLDKVIGTGAKINIKVTNEALFKIYPNSKFNCTFAIDIDSIDTDTLKYFKNLLGNGLGDDIEVAIENGKDGKMNIVYLEKHDYSSTKLFSIPVTREPRSESEFVEIRKPERQKPKKPVENNNTQTATVETTRPETTAVETPRAETTPTTTPDTTLGTTPVEARPVEDNDDRVATTTAGQQLLDTIAREEDSQTRIEETDDQATRTQKIENRIKAKLSRRTVKELEELVGKFVDSFYDKNSIITMNKEDIDKALGGIIEKVSVLMAMNDEKVDKLILKTVLDKVGKVKLGYAYVDGDNFYINDKATIEVVANSKFDDGIKHFVEDLRATLEKIRTTKSYTNVEKAVRSNVARIKKEYEGKIERLEARNLRFEGKIEADKRIKAELRNRVKELKEWVGVYKKSYQTVRRHKADLQKASKIDDKPRTIFEEAIKTIGHNFRSVTSENLWDNLLELTKDDFQDLLAFDDNGVILDALTDMEQTKAQFQAEQGSENPGMTKQQYILHQSKLAIEILDAVHKLYTEKTEADVRERKKKIGTIYYQLKFASEAVNNLNERSKSNNSLAMALKQLGWDSMSIPQQMSLLFGTNNEFMGCEAFNAIWKNCFDDQLNAYEFCDEIDKLIQTEWFGLNASKKSGKFKFAKNHFSDKVVISGHEMSRGTALSIYAQSISDNAEILEEVGVSFYDDLLRRDISFEYDDDVRRELDDILTKEDKQYAEWLIKEVVNGRARKELLSFYKGTAFLADTDEDTPNYLFRNRAGVDVSQLEREKTKEFGQIHLYADKRMTERVNSKAPIKVADFTQQVNEYISDVSKITRSANIRFFNKMLKYTYNGGDSVRNIFNKMTFGRETINELEKRHNYIDVGTSKGKLGALLGNTATAMILNPTTILKMPLDYIRSGYYIGRWNVVRGTVIGIKSAILGRFFGKTDLLTSSIDEVYNSSTFLKKLDSDRLRLEEYGVKGKINGIKSFLGRGLNLLSTPAIKHGYIPAVMSYVERQYHYPINSAENIERTKEIIVSLSPMVLSSSDREVSSINRSGNDTILKSIFYMFGSDRELKFSQFYDMAFGTGRSKNRVEVMQNQKGNLNVELSETNTAIKNVDGLIAKANDALDGARSELESLQREYDSIGDAGDSNRLAYEQQTREIKENAEKTLKETAKELQKLTKEKQKLEDHKEVLGNVLTSIDTRTKVEQDYQDHTAKRVGRFFLMSIGLSAVIETLIEHLGQMLKGRKKEPDMDTLGDLGWSIATSYLPIVDTIVNAIRNDSDLSPSTFKALSDGVKTIQSTIDMIGNGFDEKDAMKTIKQFIVTFGYAVGVPTKTFFDYIEGTIKNLNGTSGYEVGSWLNGYSSSYLTNQANNRISKNDLDGATDAIQANIAMFKTGSIKRNTAREITRLKSLGYHCIPADYNYDDAKPERREKARELYAKANKYVENMVTLSSYARLDDSKKSKAIKKLYDAYYEASKTVATGNEPSSKLARLVYELNGELNLVDVVIASVNVKDAGVKAILNDNTLSTKSKMLAKALTGYALSDEEKKSLYAYLTSLGVSPEFAIELAKITR